MSKTKFKLILQNRYDDIDVTFGGKIDIDTYKYQKKIESNVKFLSDSEKLLSEIFETLDLHSCLIILF